MGSELGGRRSQRAASLAAVRACDLCQQLAVVVAGEEAVEGIWGAVEAVYYGGLVLELAFGEEAGERHHAFHESAHVVEDDEAFHSTAPRDQIDIVRGSVGVVHVLVLRDGPA